MPTTALAASAPISDLMITQGAARTIDAAAAFGREGLTYAVQASNGGVATGVAIDATTGVLTFTGGDLGHSDIRIVATDAAGQTHEDYFRVRVAGENAYTIAVMPDTQDYTDANLNNGAPETFYAMTQWLADNKDAHNINFVAHVGDITQNNLAEEWVVAETALRTLDGVIPYSLLPGNHDQAVGGTAADHSSVFLDSLFSPDKQEATSPDNFGGVYDQEPERSSNNYQTFTATDGTKWLVLSMEFGPRDDVIRWADDVLSQHLDHRVIVNSHSLTNFAGRHDPAGGPLYDEGAGYDYGMGKDPEGANDGETVYRELLAKYPNVAFTFSGHIFGDGAETNVSYSQHGNAVYEMLVNYQNGISREITGNGDAALGTRGGNGAIRLVTIDPDNDRVTTETYFTEFDDYLDGFRTKAELDRDGLTGLYRGHQETFADIDLSTPELRAQAKAGDDMIVTADAGSATAEVALDASRTLDPTGDISRFDWSNADGDVLGVGETATVELAEGAHELTLRVTDEDGNVTTDEVVVIVKGDGTKLADTFNDGDADGWIKPGASEAPALAVGTPESFGIAALPGGAERVARVPAFGPNEAVYLAPNLGAPAGTLIASYSLVFDILVPADQGTWTSLFQSETVNTSDGELFIRKNADGTGGIGISGDYPGAFLYGAWQRVAFTFAEQADGSVTLSKYIDGALAGEQTVSGDRFKLDVSKGALLFSDESGETSELYVSSTLITDKVFSAEEVAALGGAKSGGITAAAPTPLSVQFDFNGPDLAATYGVATLSVGLPDASASGNFLVKGSVFGRTVGGEGLAAPEAALYDMSDSDDNVLVWGAEDAAGWTDYVFESRIQSLDNDSIGVVFRYADEENHYRLTLNSETATRELVKVKDGVETVLASVGQGSPFNIDAALKIVVSGDEITAFLDGKSIFDGPVIDATDPLGAGTVGFYSDEQRSSIFDDAVVSEVALTAHAGGDARVADTDGDGSVTVGLDAGSSYGLAAIDAWEWKDAEGAVVATTETADVALTEGDHRLTLTVTDAAGATATDTVNVKVLGETDVLASEDFGSRASLGRFTIVDEGEMGGVGADGLKSNWTLSQGALVQTSDLQSRQLEWQGASNPDVWLDGWSPLGDGVNVLRKGTYAVYNDPAAAAWTNYSVEATIETPDDDGLGFLVHYVDPDNYYKVELDADGDYDRDPGNGAGSTFQLIRMRDGIEEILGQLPAKYAPGEAMTLRVDILDGKIQAYLDGEAIFAYPIEDHAHEAGTFALYSWGSAGVRFDDLVVTALDDDGAPGERLVGTTGGDTLAGTAFDDNMFGGSGDDSIDAGVGDDSVNGGLGIDTVLGGDGRDLLSGLGGADTLEGGAGDDTLGGQDGNDKLRGQDGDDVLRGAAGNDALAGGEGGDTLSGGAGADRLIGQGGADVFAFGPAFGQDIVVDFDADQDFLTFSAGLYADFDALTASAQVVGGNLVLTVDAANAITLQGAELADLSIDNVRIA